MLKRFLFLIVFVLAVCKGYGQTMTATELLKLVGLSAKECDFYLTSQKHFKLLGSSTIHDITTSTYILGKNLPEIIIIRRKPNEDISPTLEYHILPITYIYSLRKELVHLGFRLKTDNPGDGIASWVYYGKTYEVLLVKMDNGLPATMYIVKR